MATSDLEQTQPTIPFRPTIKDVARIAGVHFTTVAMALRGGPRIPVATRNRIIAAANRIGYQRNEVFAALSRHRRREGSGVTFVPTIAYITNQSEQNGLFATAYQRHLVAGARKQVESSGMRFELLSVDAGAHTSQSLQAHLIDHHVGGLIISALDPGRTTLSLDWGKFCIVKIDSRHVEPAATFVSHDQLHDVTLGFSRFRELGYRRIGLAVGSKDEEGTDQMHLAGWLAVQSRLPAEEQVPLLLFPAGLTHLRDLGDLLHDWIARYRVDAVLCNWSNVRNLVGRAGFRCPDQVAAACICLSRRTTGVAGIVANFDLVGLRAAALLADLMRMEQRGLPASPTATYVRGYWTEGSSAPPRK